ncbi:hypothetical protein [Botrimarina hoheduenensis]|uniref:Uncharacterized protein n=1 Tax=Botrimarina hoheduenensis TaxID=2528000 RepID=A0A5C5W946_9BACT|nr:hypothetical protein [Botrimarina hoheduenensis]TWT46549.1 hypothetical protein Pla111_16450 [Botrimarina hoheduenensis]
MSAPRLQPLHAALAPALLALGACGCAEEPKSLLDEIKLMPSREELVEVPLGSFLIPVPVLLEDGAERFSSENLIELDFDLVAIVDPVHRARVERYKNRYEGRLRNEVIKVCRNTARDDVLESEWSTLKAHLLDATQPLLGGLGVRRLATPRIVKEPL